MNTIKREPALRTFAHINAPLPLAEDVAQAIAMRLWTNLGHHLIPSLKACGHNVNWRHLPDELPPQVQHLLLHTTREMLGVLIATVEGEPVSSVDQLAAWLKQQDKREAACEIAGKIA